jgi:hypothetical protein
MSARIEGHILPVELGHIAQSKKFRTAALTFQQATSAERFQNTYSEYLRHQQQTCFSSIF